MINELSDFFRENLRDYVFPGNRVAEIYHGDKHEILGELENIISNGEKEKNGNKGVVYSINRSQNSSSYLKKLERSPFIVLVNQSYPLENMNDLDAIVLSNFFNTYDISSQQDINVLYENPQTYKAIDRAINPGGYLIIHLNQTEKENERDDFPVYRSTLNEHFPRYAKVCDNEDLIVYKKHSHLKS